MSHRELFTSKFSFPTESCLIGIFAMFCLGSAWAQSGSGDESQPPRREFVTAQQPAKTVEDLTVPSLQGSELKAVDTLVGEVDRQPEFTRELTRVSWRAGDPIDLYIFKPTGVKKPPVILFLYSYPFDNERFLQNDFGKFLTRNGFAAICFDSSLTGQRYHDVPLTEWFVSDLGPSLAVTAHDVQMILNYLTTRGDLDVDNVGMFGDGSGATIAVLAAAVDSRIKSLDLLDPWGDWPDWVAKSTLIPEKERPDYLKPEFLAAAAPLDPLKWLPQLKTQKIRIQHVKSVTVTPDEARQKIEAAAPTSAQIVRYDDTKAFLKTVSGGRGLDWLKESIQSSAIKEYSANGGSQSKGTSAQANESQR